MYVKYMYVHESCISIRAKMHLQQGSYKFYTFSQLLIWQVWMMMLNNIENDNVWTMNNFVLRVQKQKARL